MVKVFLVLVLLGCLAINVASLNCYQCQNCDKTDNITSITCNEENSDPPSGSTTSTKDPTTTTKDPTHTTTTTIDPTTTTIDPTTTTIDPTTTTKDPTTTTKDPTHTTTTIDPTTTTIDPTTTTIDPTTTTIDSTTTATNHLSNIDSVELEGKPEVFLHPRLYRRKRDTAEGYQCATVKYEVEDKKEQIDRFCTMKKDCNDIQAGDSNYKAENCKVCDKENCNESSSAESLKNWTILTLLLIAMNKVIMN